MHSCMTLAAAPTGGPKKPSPKPSREPGPKEPSGKKEPKQKR